MHSLPLADAWIAAAAALNGVILVHKDPDLGALPVEREALPYRWTPADKPPGLR